MEPVDAEAWNIPTYFEIIKCPMDLGTVLSKLKKNEYYSIFDFGDDVQLTFDNAMKFNPPGNYVYLYADKLDKIFDNYYRHIIRVVNERKRMKELKQQRHKFQRYFDDDELDDEQLNFILIQLRDTPKNVLQEIFQIMNKEEFVIKTKVDFDNYANSDLRYLFDLLKYIECNSLEDY